MVVTCQRYNRRNEYCHVIFTRERTNFDLFLLGTSQYIYFSCNTKALQFTITIKYCYFDDSAHDLHYYSKKGHQTI